MTLTLTGWHSTFHCTLAAHNLYWCTAGFSTAKGELVRSILYPKPVDQKLYNDGMKLCIVSAMLGLVAVVYTSVMFAITEGTTLFAIIINALDIITFVVPASLPAMLTIGTIYAQRRLEKAGIYCLSSEYINLSGVLDICCFDKVTVILRCHSPVAHCVSV